MRKLLEKDDGVYYAPMEDILRFDTFLFII